MRYINIAAVTMTSGGHTISKVLVCTLQTLPKLKIYKN